MMKSRTQVAAGLALLVLGTALLAVVFTSPVAAEDGSGFFDPVLADDQDTDDGWLSSVTSGLGGLSDRVAYGARTLVYGPEHSAAESADAVQAEFNEHSAAYQRYANNRVTASTEHDVVQLTFELDDETATRYLVADVNATSGEYENATIVETTDRSVDDEIVLSGYAADNAESELVRFREDFVEPGENVTRSYKSNMGSRYLGHVEQDLYGGDSS